MDDFSLWQECKSSIAYKTHQRIYAMNIGNYILYNNYKKLIAEENRLSNEDIDKEKYDYINIINLFFNFISSIYALRDTSEKIIRCDVLSQKLQEKAEQKRVATYESDLIYSIKNLRNIMTHEIVVMPSFVTNIKLGSIVSGFAFSVEKIISLPSLAKRSRDYFKKIEGEYIFLSKISQDCFSIIKEYQYWLTSELMTKHKSKHPEYWDLRNRMQIHWDGDTPICNFK